MAEQGANLGLAALSVAFLFGILGLFAFFALRAKTAAEEEEKQEKQQAAGGQRRRGALDRMQRGAARAAGGGEADEDEPENQAGNKKANAAKEQKKQERRAQQQAEREAYQQKQDKKDKYAQKQQAREAERLRRDAEDEQARKEKEKREKEELDKWKEMFAVEYEGEDDAATAGESALEQFIEYVKLRKVVNLEDLAAEFRMRTVTAINRLEELEKMGRLSGIFDDRGKYIYITAEEMGEVAAWLKRKGRVNRAELVAGCNKLIRLDPTAEDKAKLEAEVRTAEEKLEGQRVRLPCGVGIATDGLEYLAQLLAPMKGLSDVKKMLAAVVAAVLLSSWQGFSFLGSMPTGQQAHKTARQASVVDSLKNPVKTVSETIDEFYKGYPKPPVLPMYRSFLVDFITQVHLTMVDSRFKYDAIFGLGMRHFYSGLMGNYDKLVMSEESEKIWKALNTAMGMKPDQVTADAEAVAKYASSTSPAEILQHMEGTAKPSDAKIGTAFEQIQSSLYSMTYSIGLFRIMELSGVEVNKANAEEWAKALKIEPASKVTSDLETYKQNQVKLQKAEEMIREIEIREKKKLAEKLEQKAKALAEKAAAKKSGGEDIINHADCFSMKTHEDSAVTSAAIMFKASN
ncbi:unnamed protein product [Symbiodinium necroappetens]|uniref:DDRGK domain-containing protein 1 n=1 Tax=Symbiodinium necroappetens TaxID=1628268 RepID=A0A812ME73_9DINO|nr:unnamed protein product [Symbiodinium necroappetens]